MSTLKNKPWFYKLSTKIIAYCLLVALSLTAFSGMAALFGIFQFQAYTNSFSDTWSRMIQSDLPDLADQVVSLYVENPDDPRLAQNFITKNNLAVRIQVQTTDPLPSESGAANEPTLQSLWSYGSFSAVPDANMSTYEVPYDFAQAEHDTYIVQIGLRTPLVQPYAGLHALLSVIYKLRYAIYPLLALVLAGWFVCLLYLLTAVGHHPGETEVRPNALIRCPWDVGTILIFIPNISVFAALTDYGISGLYSLIPIFIWLIVNTLIFPLYAADFALRVKLGAFRRTVCYRLGKLLGRGGKKCGKGLAALIRRLPFIWKTVVVLAVVCLYELFFVCATYSSEMGFFLFLEKLILVPAVLYAAVLLRRLWEGTRALAQGDLSYQVDTTKMFWDLKTGGENLNQIGQGLNRAVEERMKSERMKTELITNVSHDIKTPLTSIINYADLIGKEPKDSEKIPEYAEVLTRQSVRLKRLLENLVEASKASTGNLEVNLSPCEIGVLLAQVTGEYSGRFAEKGLELVIQQPEESLYLMADSRHLWRILDNLMNNILKYAMSGTRAYVSVQASQTEIILTLKNISSQPLNISAEELMGRFVRGDSSRNTEGNGLGLSIAQSLAQLQKGQLELVIDGDLFKAILHFPRLK